MSVQDDLRWIDVLRVNDGFLKQINMAIVQVFDF